MLIHMLGPLRPWSTGPGGKGYPDQSLEQARFCTQGALGATMRIGLVSWHPKSDAMLSGYDCGSVSQHGSESLAMHHQVVPVQTQSSQCSF